MLGVWDHYQPAISLDSWGRFFVNFANVVFVKFATAAASPGRKLLNALNSSTHVSIWHRCPLRLSSLYAIIYIFANPDPKHVDIAREFGCRKSRIYMYIYSRCGIYAGMSLVCTYDTTMKGSDEEGSTVFPAERCCRSHVAEGNSFKARRTLDRP